MLSSLRGRRSSSRSSWKAPFSASQTALVSAVRTIRAFSRAAAMQDATEDGFSRSKNRWLTTFRSTASPYFFSKAAKLPLACRIGSHSLR